MKYLKLFENNKIEKIFTPLINWEMINDLKDLSLEYIDDGYVLFIDVYYNSIKSDNRIFYILFSHKENQIQWEEKIPNTPKNVDNEKIFYSFKLMNNENYGYKQIDRGVEVFNSIKGMYPEENVDVLRFKKS